MAAGASDKQKLSGLGRQLETSLISMLRELAAEVDVEEPDPAVPGGKRSVKKPKYSLLDKLRVYDRALKLEAIKHKIQGDEGGFFGTQQRGQADE